MTTSESDIVKLIRSAPINYALLKLIHHEVGNGLAVLSGYRHLLQKAISDQAREPFPPTQHVWQARNERALSYLRTMQDRERLLNNLLVQLRNLSSEATDKPLYLHFIRTDLVALIRLIIDTRALLCPNNVFQVYMPTQPLFIMCDPFWMQALFEHTIFNPRIVRHTDSVPTEIHLEPFQNSIGWEAKITFRFRSDLPKLKLKLESETAFEALIQQLEQGESEACAALNHKILHEHGGYLWSEQEGSISIALPLVEESSIVNVVRE
ncbi:hypothetical protein KDA_48680 [Dictyobacter alpinus]|uniref:Uncharacterized protein n=1 Tax=Dictyobacter alpinus TaxID=2014873 RepID=A0A402BDF1_9CHLR|nr:HAMP domain-containing histidine kinase [Dictyobacter alpinus]GCE29384.1 hypothetical protein KDA_48680 [Dictyobacter alpinus]